MTFSKKSLNFFANQYNVAVSTKAVYFKVENTSMNREVLGLLYREGFIANYSFNFEDVFLDEDVDKSLMVLPYTRKIQRDVDPKLYFFNLISLALVQREQLPTKVINDKDQIPEDMFSITQLNSIDFRLDDNLLLFIYKILDLFYTLKKKVKTNSVLYVYNKDYSYWYEPMSSIIVDKHPDWMSFFKTILDLKKCHDHKEMDHDPITMLFSCSFETILIEYIYYLYNIDVPYQDDDILTRAQMQITLYQDSWKYQDTLYSDDRILVFPKYISSTPVIKSLKTCGGNVVRKYVTFAELTLLKQEKGYTTFYIMSTDKGLVLDSVSNLLFQRGGQLLLSIKV